MNFAEPKLLWFLLLVPALGWFLLVAWKRRKAAVSIFVQSRLLDSLTVGLSNGRRKARMILSLVAVFCVILALGRPRWGYKWDEAKQRGLDIIVGIDASRSMLATDVKPNRLERAKLAALDLMKLAQSDRLGLIAFAGTSFLQCPLTLDEGAFRQSVSALSPDIMPQGGTALAETIAVAIDAFKNEEENHKVLVLISDGEDHQEQVLEYAEEASKAGLRIFTIGVGSPNGELIPLGREGGKTVYLKDDQGQVVKSRLNEALLQQIAGKAKGFYLNLSGAGAIETLYTRGLAPLPKGEITARLVRVYFERFYWPLSAAIVLLLIEMFLPDQRRRRQTGKLAATVALMLSMSASASGVTPAEARNKFSAGEYEAAAEIYQQLQAANPEDARLSYNAGVAAYRAENYDLAQREFSSAIAAKDEKLQQSAWYNLGNTYFKTGRAESAPDKKLESWKTALKMYEQAQKFDSAAEDARANQSVLQRMVEELEKQMEKQKQEGEDGEDKDEEKKDDQDQNKGDQDKKGEQKDQQDSKSDDEKKEQEKQESQQQDKEKGDGKDDKKPEQEPQPNPDSKDQDKGDEEKQSSPQPEPSDQKKPGEENRSAPQPQLGKLSREQAMKMLEAQKSFERPLIFRPPAERKTDSKQAITKKW